METTLPGNLSDSPHWILDDLYAGFDDPAYKNDFDALKHEIKSLEDWAEQNLRSSENPIEKIEVFLKRMNGFEQYVKLIDYAFLVLSADTLHELAMKQAGVLEEILAELSKSQVLFKQFVGRLPNLEELISHSACLAEHRFFLLKI